MITEFGKFLRSLRQSHAELLKDMAETLNISAAFLSAVEAGKKSIPATLVSQVIEAYELPAKQIQQLKAAVDESQRSATIDLEGVSPEARGVAVALARQFNSLSNDELESLKKTMDEVRKRMKG
jgi:transcriptional regulator with XRE-family HTH domain